MKMTRTTLMMFAMLTMLLLPKALSSQTTTGAVLGRITSSDGTAMKGVRVVALETSYPRMNIASQAETDSEGRFVLDEIDPGDYFVIADPFDRPSFYPGVGNRDDAKRVTIAAGAILRDLNFKFVPASGVINSSRAPAQGVTKLSGVIHDIVGSPEPRPAGPSESLQAKQNAGRARTLTAHSSFPI